MDVKMDNNVYIYVCKTPYYCNKTCTGTYYINNQDWYKLYICFLVTTLQHSNKMSCWFIYIYMVMYVQVIMLIKINLSATSQRFPVFLYNELYIHLGYVYS